MSVKGARPVLSLSELRSGTAERLRGRRREIQEAVIHRALSVAPPTGKESPGYVEALRAAIPSAIEYAFDAIDSGEERVGPTPPPILNQAASSARSGVGLEVVMRRYATGYSRLSDFLHQETSALGGELEQVPGMLQRELTALFDRLVVEVTDAYRQEESRIRASPRHGRLERIRRLMAGELIDPSGLNYPFEAQHIAMIIAGEDSTAVAFAIARRLEARLLVGERSGERVAVWLGGSTLPAHTELTKTTQELAGRAVISFGEQGHDLTGWRRTRRQAEAAHLVALRGTSTVTSYRDVALLASALRDPDLAHFLRETYIEPLFGDQDRLEETFAAYLRSNWNASSTAAALGVSRQTVSSRLRLVEQRLDRRLEDCVPELLTALLLNKLRVDR